MRLRTQLFLAGLLAAVCSGALGTWLIGQQAARSAEGLLDGQLRTGEQALRRQWELHRAQQRSVYEAVSNQTFLRAYLGAGDRAQMSYFVEFARQKGADLAAIVDRSGAVLASTGQGADQMAQKLTAGEWPDGGELLVLQDQMYDAFRLPIGGEQTAGYLLAANRISLASLNKDASLFGIFAAIAAGGVCISTVPSAEPFALPGLRSLDAAELERIRLHYRLRVVNFGPGRLLIAIPLTPVRVFAAEFLRQAAVVFILLLSAIATVSLILLRRVTRPIEQLNRAAASLGRGQLQRSRALIQTLQSRPDEIGGLALTLYVAAERLTEVVAGFQELAQDIHTTVSAMENSASEVATGAARQEERLAEVLSILGPAMSRLDEASQDLVDMGAVAVRLSVGMSATEQATPQHAASAPKTFGEPRETLQTLRSQFASFSRRLQDVGERHRQSQHQGHVVRAASSEIGRLAKRHAEEAKALRVSAERLRHDTEQLRQLLSRMQTQA